MLKPVLSESKSEIANEISKIRILAESAKKKD